MPSTCFYPHGNGQWPSPGPPHRQRRQVGCTNRWRLALTTAGDMLGQAQAWRAFSLTNQTTGSAYTLQLCEIPSSQESPVLLTSSLPPIAASQPAGACPGVPHCPEQSFFVLSQEVTQNAKPDAVLQCLGSIWELHLPYLSRSKTLSELYMNYKKQRNKLLQERSGCIRAGMSGWHGGVRRWTQTLKEDGGMTWVSRGSLRCTLLHLPVHDHSVTKEAVSFALRTLYRPTESPEQWGDAVLSAAVLLGLPDLYQRCLDGMMATITSDTVCDFHQASCKHKQIGLQAACEHWLELFLVTDLSSHIGLRDLPFELLLRTLRCSRVFAVCEYDLLQTVLYWIYLQFNTSKQTLPSYSTVISFFCGITGAFLEQPVGYKYVPLFEALHLHGITERHHVEEMEKMNVFPHSWLLHTFSSHYCSIHSGGDMNVTNFSKHSVRFGMIVGGELQEYTQAVGLYGFYFLLKTSRVGDADEFGFSLERLRHWDPALTESCRTTQPFSMRAERCVCYQIRVQSCGGGEWMEKSSGVISQVFGLSKRCSRSKVFAAGGLSLPLYVTFALAFPTP
ncbi:BTB/POZ domain-containing protein 16 [Astyanax mexicanus]|uniref:BTB/POZ domain-containing protein 16 n=1 Tax=Astyanax mexicanus TaxID=7994 RepID=A0A8T2L6J8_ASTMX|nr:BTB/POZ domain-containing protein 16 [Astyanax mexicanus]